MTTADLSEPGYWQFHPFIVTAYGDPKRRGKRGDDSRWLRAELYLNREQTFGEAITRPDPRDAR